MRFTESESAARPTNLIDCSNEARGERISHSEYSKCKYQLTYHDSYWTLRWLVIMQEEILSMKQPQDQTAKERKGCTCQRDAACIKERFPN
eukprot:1150430-Pelagomonas_calceolata.AAC.1